MKRMHPGVGRWVKNVRMKRMHPRSHRGRRHSMTTLSGSCAGNQTKHEHGTKHRKTTAPLHRLVNNCGDEVTHWTSRLSDSKPNCHRRRYMSGFLLERFARNVSYRARADKLSSIFILRINGAVGCAFFRFSLICWGWRTLAHTPYLRSASPLSSIPSPGFSGILR
jgi:hypothetical protein